MARSPHRSALMSSTDTFADPERVTALLPAEASADAAAEPRAWINLRAPDARSVSAASVPVAAGGRALRVFLRNPNAMFGVAFLSIVVLAALLAPLLYPGDPLAMVARPF